MLTNPHRMFICMKGVISCSIPVFSALAVSIIDKCFNPMQIKKEEFF